jgi:hypothetical protein
MVRGNDYLEVYPSYQCEVEELISAIKGIGLQVEDLNYSKQIVR